MTLRIGVLALQGDVREHLAALSALDVEGIAVRSRADLSAIDGLVIPGGESTTMSLLAERDGLLEPLRDAVAAGLPAYGSCAGLIMLAASIVDGRPDQQTLGALDIVVRRNAFGRQVDSFEAPVAMPDLGPEPFPAVFIRAPWVESASPEVQVLARLGDGAPDDRIVAVRQGDVMATAFHPELTGDTRIHGYFVEIVRHRA